jgi:hypothetical protein
MCTVEKVADDLQTFFVFETHACHVGADDETGQEEHGSAIFARPMAVVGLEVFVERVPVPSSLERRFCSRQVWQVLREDQARKTKRDREGVPEKFRSNTCRRNFVAIARIRRPC